MSNTTESENNKYIVDNAIIMAAGESKRCLPLSSILPKGLFKVKGEVLIEREIRQLKDAGVNNIIVVVGYMADKFDYLREKYGVHIVVNDEYDKKNNISSIYAVRKYLGNSYICCADNYYVENIFRDHENRAYYTCEYTDEYADEYCIDEDVDDKINSIIRGGKKAWYTIGANFWTADFSAKFVELLESEYDNPEIWNMLIDDFHIRHFSELPIYARKMKPEVVLEFDTLEEFEAFDPDFRQYEKDVIADNLYGSYNHITRYAGVLTDNKKGRLHFNENLWGPSPDALKPFQEAESEELYLYDSAQNDILVDEISTKYHIPSECIFLHNSGSEIARSIISIMVGKDDNVLLPMPHWSYYPGVVDYRFGKKYFYRFNEDGDKCYHDVDDLMEKADIYRPRMIIVTSPAMPSGNLIRPDDLEKIVKNNPASLIFVDQAYMGFEKDPIDVNYFISNYDNVLFSRTFSKFFALAGLRLGYGIASERAMRALWLDLPLLRLPIIARKSAIACLRDDEYYNRIRKDIHNVKVWFYNELKTIECLHPYMSDTNFIYMKVNDIDAPLLRKKMIKQGYLYRIYEYNDSYYYRINVAPMNTMSDFMNKFRDTIRHMENGR